MNEEITLRDIIKAIVILKPGVSLAVVQQMIWAKTARSTLAIALHSLKDQGLFSSDKVDNKFRPGFKCHVYYPTKKLLDQIRGKWEAPELIRQAKTFWVKHQDPTNRGLLQSMKIEDKASGTGLIQTLKVEGVPVIGIPRSTDKFTRAQNVLAQIEAGLVHLPRHLAFTKDLLGELAMFPNGVNDDQVDPLIDAIADNLVTGYNLSAW